MLTSTGKQLRDGQYIRLFSLSDRGFLCSARGKGECWKCGNFGHWAKNCEAKQPNPGYPQGPLSKAHANIRHSNAFHSETSDDFEDGKVRPSRMSGKPGTSKKDVNDETKIERGDTDKEAQAASPLTIISRGMSQLAPVALRNALLMRQAEGRDDEGDGNGNKKGHRLSHLIKLKMMARRARLDNHLQEAQTALTGFKNQGDSVVVLKDTQSILGPATAWSIEGVDVRKVERGFVLKNGQTVRLRNLFSGWYLTVKPTEDEDGTVVAGQFELAVTESRTLSDTLFHVDLLSETHNKPMPSDSSSSSKSLPKSRSLASSMEIGSTLVLRHRSTGALIQPKDLDNDRSGANEEKMAMNMKMVPCVAKLKRKSAKRIERKRASVDFDSDENGIEDPAKAAALINIQAWRSQVMEISEVYGLRLMGFASTLVADFVTKVGCVGMNLEPKMPQYRVTRLTLSPLHCRPKDSLGSSNAMERTTRSGPRFLAILAKV